MRSSLAQPETQTVADTAPIGTALDEICGIQRDRVSVYCWGSSVSTVTADEMGSDSMQCQQICASRRPDRPWDPSGYRRFLPQG
jgi:hypothetical protein